MLDFATHEKRRVVRLRGNKMSRIYRVLTRMALPIARLYLRHRAKKQPEYLEHWDERFGLSLFPAPTSRPRLWFHAVSVGETLASRSLIGQFLKRYPDSEILLTCMTPTGREVGKKLTHAWPGRITQCYLPYDTPELAARFFDQTRPKMGIIMETEVWPNLMEAARARSIPVVLANARESEKSRRQAARFPSIMQPAFAAFSLVLAQSEADKKRLISLGARNIRVCGSVKFDIRPDVAQEKKAFALKEAIDRPIVLLASTRQGEEALFLDALDVLDPKALVWLVPRHPQRFDEVEGLLKERDILYARKTTTPDLLEAARRIRVVLADTLGEMSFNCALGDVCLMGGSFGNFGSQNLIEPAATGVPVIIGPSTFNFAKPAEDAVCLGAASRVKTPREALALADTWLHDGTLKERSAKARAFASSYTGATEKMMGEIAQLWEKTL